MTRSQQLVVAGLYLLLTGAFTLFLVNDFASPPFGDEEFYIPLVGAFRTRGLVQSIVEGNPVGYSLAVSLLSQTGAPLLLAGRLVSLLSIVPLLLGQFYIARRVLQLNTWFCHLVIIFSLQALIGSRAIFAAVTDIYFSAVLIWALIFVLKTIDDWRSWRNPVIAGTLLAVTLLIRPLTLLYLPGIFIALAVAVGCWPDPRRGKRQSSWRCIVLGSAFTGVFLLQQSPSVAQKGTVSFEVKRSPSGRPWFQRHTLSQFRYDDGTLPQGQHVTWEQLDAYLEANGEDALPHGYVERARRYPRLVVREFVKDLLVGTQYAFLRRTGLFYLLILGGLLGIRQLRTMRGMVVLAIVVLGYVVSLSSVVLTNVEWRWLILPVLLCSAVGAAVLQHLAMHKSRLYPLILSVQLIFLLGSVSLDVYHVVSSEKIMKWRLALAGHDSTNGVPLRKVVGYGRDA